MTKTARRLIADLPTLASLDGTELVTVEINGRKYQVPLIDIGGLPRTGTTELTLTDLTNLATLSTADGKWSKVGPEVRLYGTLQSSSLGSVSGAIYIGGLPFAASTGSWSYGSLVVGRATGLAITAGQVVTGYINTTVSANHMGLQLWDSAAGTTAMQASEWSADGRIFFSLTYLTDED